jgi:uncharacterized protein (TIGR00299 family) protein
MRIAYLDCASGISGDMTLAALVDAGAELAALQRGVDSLSLAGCRFVAREVKKCGFRATQITVEHAAEHAHRHLHHILEMIDRGAIAPRPREWAKRIFARLAEAEARVHGTTIEKVHFHEVGAADSIADIVGSAIGFDLLGIERVICSPVPTGRGSVQIAHGRCAIPAPATGELLRGVPLAPLDVEGELTTPTGAAIVAAMAEEYGALPAMIVDQIGYGAGKIDFPHPNLLRILIGRQASVHAAPFSTPAEIESVGSAASSARLRPRLESIVVLETNLDDAGGETVGHAVERLWASGALDVSLAPLSMKKGRPGVLISVQAQPADADRLEAVLFEETTTLGVRRMPVMRKVLARRAEQVDTIWGPVAGKVAFLPDGRRRFTPEYEDCRRIADEQRVRLADVITAAGHAFCATERQRPPD